MVAAAGTAEAVADNYLNKKRSCQQDGAVAASALDEILVRVDASGDGGSGPNLGRRVRQDSVFSPPPHRRSRPT
jgi:hypothetical protein